MIVFTNHNIANNILCLLRHPNNVLNTSSGTQIMGNDATHEDGDEYDGDDLIHLEHWNNVLKNPA